ncbi:MAG: asparaginyl/glutamyl-tRNA amidotransferase subunit C [Deltaproteobacteria bacterium RIFCSPLOWO2_12_FULL_40_28]|nr:MAG: asparaginyl/glutamyl-tRNA amidotransferase subunit C [Deltaproteobacteria bacterium RIFCSPHIGHO2_02_FULL_40_28]OGQ20414.1 MAG: asparaginyl/glutamyl-tRNA amidotransferase subunit C [Deltaproteobacteria bacterium RIFCSPHIGHO2_12_FULL_40_32]OGQ41383.1 MAG: asparaginyl/glutamyl-tRNA amidotransferase subunit C [Deltaproteobacteria bacterium RIFCSPLOWO2_02_FULL_40_36]OGQ55022.1 MAG: asparaginyl/glutamyl-tRNA amidotransferase subunit C [Deltaproteobacteria bacterium RIFCSPLOWO2_12_FULL_40_28]
MVLKADDIEKAALLSRLALSDEEKKSIQEKLEQILGYMEKLEELDLKNVEATSHAVSLSNVFRPDHAYTSKEIEDILEQAPDKASGMFRVPKVIG